MKNECRNKLVTHTELNCEGALIADVGEKKIMSGVTYVWLSPEEMKTISKIQFDSIATFPVQKRFHTTRSC